ncbi:AAA domain-containing protein [Amycolatopsis sacchari]|uniref:AAA domain-containing protein n=1 Tax=Amycolatopsis sacchari TaxID=115433 RepID=A0A1I3KT38_9PSEU|nr:AAA domain-containing protein [Amycolatopsis sacchari]
MPVTLSPLSNDWQTERTSNRGWPQFLESVRIDGLRGWKDSLVEFRFPVVALAGENGAGKSTVLKAAAAAYGDGKKKPESKAFYPDDFFPNTPWEVVKGVTLTYQIRRGDSSDTIALRKPTSRWRGMPERFTRPVFFLDISRTQPINTTVGYGKLANQRNFSGDLNPFSEKDTALLSRIMNKAYTRSVMASMEGKQIGILSTGDGDYSNFHQGAGEDATADLVALLREAPKHSLVIIDEVEASLHPRAQKRLLRELFAIARDSRMQFILSTHSPYILEQLPAEARVHIQLERNGTRNLLYGVTSNLSLSLMDDEDHPDLTLYCEDDRAVQMVDALIAQERPELRRRVAIVEAGPASVIRTLGDLAGKDKLTSASMGVLDGDQGESDGCIRLPGDAAPERVVYPNMPEDQVEIVAGRLGVRTGDLLDAIDDALRIENHHAWTRRIAELLGSRMRQTRVWEDFVAVWALNLDPTERASFVDSIDAALPKH